MLKFSLKDVREYLYIRESVKHTSEKAEKLF